MNSDNNNNNNNNDINNNNNLLNSFHCPECGKNIQIRYIDYNKMMVVCSNNKVKLYIIFINYI
jgi:ssDNA-binding Zn-finger/Zn-ribbon topoisomerase 1